MGTDTLKNRSNGEVIDQDFFNLFNRVLQGSVVGRDSSGAPTPGQNLGTPTVPWGTVRTDNLILDGYPVEPGLVTAPPNRVLSGRTRLTSDFPDYLRAGGDVNTFMVRGATTPLTYDVNGVTVQITDDIIKGGLVLAPTTNNTCQINDAALAGQDNTRFLGENGTVIVVDNMQSELTAKIGQFVVLVNQSAPLPEAIYCRIQSSTRLDIAKRGFFFDALGSPITPEALNDDDILQLYSLGYVFAENDGSTIDVTYRNPIISGKYPTSPQVGDYFYDLNVNVWKRWNGSSFIQINRTFIGMVAMDTTNCIMSRPQYFSKLFSSYNSLSLKFKDADTIRADSENFILSVNGGDKRFDFSFYEWIAATDFETPRYVDRNYWLYITEKGRQRISGYKPYDMRGFLKGWYHPYESWRAVGQIYNNSSNEFELVNDSDKTLELLDGPLNLESLTPISNSSGDPVNDIDFAPRGVNFGGYIGKKYIAQTVTKRLDAGWSPGADVGGLFSGSMAADTTYHCFAIYDPLNNLFDYGFDTSPIAANRPANYTEFKRQGSITTYDDGGTPTIRLFSQRGKYFELQNYVFVIFTELSRYPAGSRITETIVGAPIGVKMKVKLPFLWVGQDDTLIQSAIRFTDLDNIDDPTEESGTAAIFDAFLLVYYPDTGDKETGTCNFLADVVTNISAQIGVHRAGAAGAAGAIIINLAGWEDYQLEG